jgi:hypothetical protein
MRKKEEKKKAKEASRRGLSEEGAHKKIQVREPQKNVKLRGVSSNVGQLLLCDLVLF